MFQLIVISSPEVLPGEAAIIEQLFNAGLEVFHLRKPAANEKAMRQLLDAIPAGYHQRIALHSCHQLASRYGIRRLHFMEQVRNEGDGLKGACWQALAEQGCLLSTSVHSLDVLQQLPSWFAYTFFSPVFDSLSKQDYKGVVKEGFTVTRAQERVPVIALGGIDETNILTVAGMHFDGAAVLGAVWNDAANAVTHFRSLLQQVATIKTTTASVNNP